MKEKFAARLRQIRKEKNIMQKDFAEQLGINQPTYNAYEMGKSMPPCEVMVSIADKLDVSLDYLMGRVDNPKIAIIGFDDLPEELKVEGIKAVYALKEAVKTGLTADEINEILTFARNVKK